MVLAVHALRAKQKLRQREIMDLAHLGQRERLVIRAGMSITLSAAGCSAGM
jgi:hypothetical protein